MARKLKKKAQRAQRNARDFQTPAPTYVSSDSESQQPESSRTQELRYQTRRDKKGKAPEKRVNFYRSLTREGDFAPNASGQESNDETNSELGDASDQDAPIEHQPEPLSRWVKDVIRSETSKESGTMVEEFFISNDPQYEICHQFFQRLNQKVRGANKSHDVNDIDIGTIPETGYNCICQTWQQAANTAVAQSSPDEFWTAFNNTRDILKHFNKRHYLTKSWNLNQSWAEQWIGTPNPRIEEDTDSTSNSDNGQPGPPRQLSDSEESSAESDVDLDRDEPTELDPLNLLQPAKGILYPQTRILVKWKDGVLTLEGRSFIRRITNGSSLDGDRVNYQQAEELETTYRRRHGLDDIEDDDEDSNRVRDGSIQQHSGRSRRHRSQPARYSNPRNPRTRSPSQITDSIDDSDACTQPAPSHHRRYRSEPARNPTSKSFTAQIKQLEREIQLLKLRNSTSPPEGRESQRRPRDRGDRGRTA